jgi:lysophospholipase L1-like esterase
MKIEKILGSAVENGKCVVSNVALAKLAASAADVCGMLACDVVPEAATYDEATKTVTVVANGQLERITLDYAPCAHPHPFAEGKMVELDGVALAAHDGKIALIGDSLFHNWADPEGDTGLVGDISNFGVGGYCIPDLKNLTVPRHVFPTAPRAMVVHVGINDMFQGGVPLSVYLADVTAFFEWLHDVVPEAKICFLSIVRPTDIAPTVSGIVGPEADARRDAIDAANAAMREFCAVRAWAAYLDAEAAYCDEKGRSRVELFHGDGIHLIPEAYPAWGKEIGAALRLAL